MNTATAVIAQVFEREGVKIIIHGASTQVLPHSYTRMFPRRLPDTASMAELQARLSRCLEGVVFGVINPLGSAARISGQTQLGHVREYYAPNACQAVRRLFGARVMQRLCNLARVVRAV